MEAIKPNAEALKPTRLSEAECRELRALSEKLFGGKAG